MNPTGRNIGWHILKSVLVSALVCGAMIVPKNVFACLDGGLGVSLQDTTSDCCYTFDVSQESGSINYLTGGDFTNVVATINTPGVTITGASGPANLPLATSTLTQATYITAFNVPPCSSQDIFATLCLNGVPDTGASITFVGYDMSGAAAGTVTITVFPGDACLPPPCVQITCLPDLTTNCLDDSGQLVTFNLPTATRTCTCSSGPLTVEASWPGALPTSASTVSAVFPMGVTPVTLTATDPCGNSNGCTFTITVVPKGSAADGSWAFVDGATLHETNAANQIPRGMAVDSDGNIFVVGIFTGTATFSGRPGLGGTPVTLTSASTITTDGFIVKYDSLGRLLWAQQASQPSFQGGGCGNVGAMAVAVDSQGNCLVSGYFQGCAFPQYYDDVCDDTILSYGDQDMFLAKFDPNGNIYWAVNAGDNLAGTNTTTGMGVAVDAQDNVYVTGGFTHTIAFNNSVVFDCLPASRHPLVLTGKGNQDAFLAKYDPWGNIVWATNSSGPLNNYTAIGRSVTVKTMGTTNAAWVVGMFQGTNVTFAGLPAGGMTAIPGGFGNAFVVNFTNIGTAALTPVWARQLTSFCTNSIANNQNCGAQDGRSIGADTNGNCYFTAYFSGAAQLGSFIVHDHNSIMGAPYSFNQNQLNDYLVASLDFNGNPRWMNNGGLLLDNESRGLAVSPAGTVFLTGELGATGQFNSGGQNILFNIYGPDGGQLLSETGVELLEPDQTSTGFGAAVDAGGCFYVTGTFDDKGGNPPTDPGLEFPNFTPQTSLAAPNGQDCVFVAKYCPVCMAKNPGCVAQPLNLALWLPFDETGGIISENLAAPAEQGVQVGGPIVNTGQYVDNSLQFSGSQYVAVPDYAGIDIGTGDFTIDAWVALTSGGTARVIVDKRNSVSGVGYDLSVSSSGQAVLTLSGTSFTDTAHGNLADGNWHFVAVSVSQSTLQASFYVDGTAGTVASLAGTINLNNTSQLWVGTSQFAGISPWIGNLDEVQIFDRALSGAEIQGVYGASTTGVCKPAAYLARVAFKMTSSTAGALSWPGGDATVEGAPTMTGPWTVIGTNVGSPFPITVGTSLQQFFRIRAP